MTIHIRPFSPVSDTDYQIIADLGNTVYPHMQRSAAELRHWIESRPPHIHALRFLAEDSASTPIGLGFAGHMLFAYQPDVMMVDILVLDQHRRRGLGMELYTTVVEATSSYDLIALRCSVREDWPASLTFADKLGYKEEMRDWESILDMAKFDPVKHSEMSQKAAEAGIVIKSARELTAMPDWDRKLHMLDKTTAVDVPFPEPTEQPDFETFQNLLLKSPNFLLEGQFIALDGDEFVGSTNLWRRDADDHLMTGLTGVLREYRGKGIASALKLRALQWAKERGTPKIHTDNATSNRPMLSINERLGFEKQPATILMSKKLKS